MTLFGGVIPITAITFFMFMIFAIIAVGFMLGRITIKGVSLGDAGVFIIALVVGCLFYGQLSSQLTVTHTTTVDYPSEHAEFVAYYEKHAGVKLTEEELASITLDETITDEDAKKEAEKAVKNAQIKLLREKAEEDRVQAEADRRDAETKRGNITEYAIKAEESASRAEKAALSVEGHGEKIILNDKRITNLEKGYSDDLFTTDDTNATTKVVPYNALPYAEVKTLAGGYSYTGGIIYPRKPLRIESCKRAEKRKLDLTLDLTEMARYMSVEKLSDGSIKFNGYTNFQGDGAGSCKFATATVPKGSNYGVTCKVVSGSYNEDATKIKANGTTIHENDVYWHDGLVNVGSDNTLTLYIESEGALSYGDLTDLVLSFEIQEGFFNDYVFEPAFVPFATLEIPEEIRNIDGYGLYDNYLDFESKQLVLVRGLNETSSGMPPLPAPVYIDVSEYLGDDNLIEVVPNGTIKVIQDTGYEMSCKSEIVYMLKGV